MKGLDLIFIPFWCGFFGVVGAMSGASAIKYASAYLPWLTATL